MSHCSSFILKRENWAYNHHKHLNSVLSLWIHRSFHKQALRYTNGSLINGIIQYWMNILNIIFPIRCEIIKKDHCAWWPLPFFNSRKKYCVAAHTIRQCKVAKRSASWNLGFTYQLCQLSYWLPGNYFPFFAEYGDVVRVKWEKCINCLHIEGTHPMVDID